MNTTTNPMTSFTIPVPAGQTGKELTITSVEISVTVYTPETRKRLHLPEDKEHVFLLHVRGTLPGCKKVVTLSDMPCAYGWQFRPLFGHSGVAHITPNDYLKAVKLAKVVLSISSDGGEHAITPELEAAARAKCEAHVFCPAVVTPTHVSPEYRPVYDRLKIDLKNP